MIKELTLNRIYNEDCIEALADMPNECVDLIVTDPPYKISSRGSEGKNAKQRPKGVLARNDGKVFNHNDVAPEKYIQLLYRVLKEDSHCYIFTNSLNLKKMLVESEKAGFKFHNLLVWEKNNCTPSQFYMKNCEYILFLRKGKAKWIKDIGGSKTVHKFNNIIGNKNHPTEKPIDLLKFYISNSSNEEDVVLDPFMGSGSTAVACQELNRNFIGFELDEEYHKIANMRLHK